MSSTNISFFNGASNVKIEGGSFSVVNGNQTVFNNSRHHTNVNSGNITSASTWGAHNDSSTNYSGIDVRRAPPPQRQSGSNQGRSGCRPPASNYPPPPPPPPPAPTLHSALYPQNLPPGSSTYNSGSFNTSIDDMRDAYNDFSQNYGSRPVNPRRDRRSSDWNSSSSSASQTGSNAAFQGYSPPGMFSPPQFPSSSASQMRSNAAFQGYSPPGMFSPPQFPSDPTYGYNQNQKFYPNYGSNGITHQSYIPPGAQAGRRPGTYNTSSFMPGEIRSFDDPQQDKVVREAMQTVNRMSEEFGQDSQPPAAPPQRGRAEVFEENEDEDSMYVHSASEDEEEEDKRMEGSVTHDMAHLSLNEKQHPAFSYNKSDPQLPQPTQSHQPDPASPNMARQSESTEYLPQHLKEPPFVEIPGPAFAHQPQQQAPQGPSRPHPPANISFDFKDTAFHGTGPNISVVNGDTTSVDNSVHTNNYGSYNSHNTHVQDSYNDSSHNVDAAPAPAAVEAPPRKRLGRNLFFRRSKP